MGGIKFGHFGDSWTRLGPCCPLSRFQSLWGEVGWHCAGIRASCVSAYYMGWEVCGGGSDGDAGVSGEGEMKGV